MRKSYNTQSIVTTDAVRTYSYIPRIYNNAFLEKKREKHY